MIMMMMMIVVMRVNGGVEWVLHTGHVSFIRFLAKSNFLPATISLSIIIGYMKKCRRCLGIGIHTHTHTRPTPLRHNLYTSVSSEEYIENKIKNKSRKLQHKDAEMGLQKRNDDDGGGSENMFAHVHQFI